jgi:hypothetical protein
LIDPKVGKLKFHGFGVLNGSSGGIPWGIFQGYFQNQKK